MSINDNAFQFSPDLQRMTAVRIIGMLLRDSKHKEMVKKASSEVCGRQSIKNRSEPKLRYLIGQLEIKVERLPVPKELKIYLKTSLLGMAMSATYWLAAVSKNTPKLLREQYWEETIYELIRHLQWDNVVCLNGRKTLESYVSNRKTVDFVIWNQLCAHCMEDAIIRFSKTIDWEECECCFNSGYSLYWYRKIYGEFPPQEMYDLDLDEYLSRNAEEIKLDEEGILKSIFAYNHVIISKFGKTASAISYFRNCLKDNRLFVELAAETNFMEITDEVILYLLRTLNLNTLCSTNAVYNSGKEVLICLTEPPYILFIDDWISVFETLDAEYIEFFFSWIGDVCRNVIDDRMRTLYEPFEKVWRICYRRFSTDSEKIVPVVVTILEKHDVMMCKLMFKVMEDKKRINLLEDVKKHVEQRGLLEDRKFSSQFSEQILNTDEERTLFSQIRRR